jgi:hypothetical protein
MKPSYKPDSVFVWSSLWDAGCPTPLAALPSTQRVTGMHSLALLPMGFTRRLRLRKPGALLPHHFALTEDASCDKILGGMFLWHFPSGHPARPLAGIAALWSPDFPLSLSIEIDIRSDHPDGFEGL